MQITYYFRTSILVLACILPAFTPALASGASTVPDSLLTEKYIRSIYISAPDSALHLLDEAEKHRRHALLLPQTITAGPPLLRLTISGQTYRLDATARNGAFEAGKSYTLNVTVSNAEITATVSINPWLTGGNSEGDAGMEI